METTGNLSSGLAHVGARGNAIGIIIAGAAAALSIIALAGIAPGMLLSIAVIATGAALLIEAISTSAEYGELVKLTTEGRLNIADLGGGGLSAEMLVGAAAIVLGILALIGLVPGVLSAVAIIALGGGLVMSSGSVGRLNDYKIEASTENDMTRRLAREAVSASSGAQVIVGLTAITLGILALVGIVPLILDLVAILAVSGVLVLTSSAVGVRILSLFHH